MARQLSRNEGRYLMRKAILLGATLMLSGALALAQDTTTTTSTTENNSAASNTVQGCLSGTSGNYMLTDATGAMYQVQGEESQLSANVNKQVEVTGTAGAKASASATNSPDANAPATANSGDASAASGNSTAAGAGATATASTSKTLSVTSIRKVADSCTANSK